MPRISPTGEIAELPFGKGVIRVDAQPRNQLLEEFVDFLFSGEPGDLLPHLQRH